MFFGFGTLKRLCLKEHTTQKGQTLAKNTVESYGIDSHKLNLHPKRVADWLDGEIIYPLYMEFSPCGACNHRCSFCTMDFMGYRSKFLETNMITERIKECAKLGVKAIMFAGEGEPLLHKDICAISKATKDAGIDISFTTNAVLLTKEKYEELLPITSWIKVSCNATDAKSYAQIHGTDEKDYTLVLKNMEGAINLRNKEKYACTLGFQCILLPESQENLVEHAKRLRDLGADYLVIKPYTQSPKSLKEGRQINYQNCDVLQEDLKKVQTEHFKVVFRSETMNRWDNKQSSYDTCNALPFWAYVDSEANVWGCLRHLQEQEFLYGNLYKQDFQNIWTGDARKQKLNWCAHNLDIKECHVTCRMNFINEYLHRLKHPLAHDNFI